MLLFLPFIPLIFFFSVIFGGVAFGLVVTGGPDPCTPGGSEPIVFSRANADSFQTKWDAFEAALDAGRPATVTFTESEVSSRGWWEVVDEAEDADDIFEGPRVCLHDGYGEVSATLDLPGFLDVKMKARGTAEITDELVIDVDKLEIGNVPGFLSDWLNAEDIRGDLTDQHLEHNYTLTLREGEAQVDGTP
jgi:hypothetical protein